MDSSSLESWRPRIEGPAGWKRRLEDPLNVYYRYPIARLLVRGLVKTPVTPNQITFVQPFLAALAGYLLTYNEWKYLVGAAVAFEVRSILDCADGTLARAKKMSSPSGHAIDAMADWLGVVLLYAGIFAHFWLYPPQIAPATTFLGTVQAYLSTNTILLLAIFCGATRSFASDYYKTKYVSIFEQGRDETVASLRRKVLALSPSSSIFAHIDVFIGRMGHLSFEHEWFDADKSQSSVGDEQIRLMGQEENTPRTRSIGVLWGLTNGDFFLSLVVLTLVLDQLWLGQVLLATVGLAWTFSVIWYNGWFVRSFQRRAKLAVA